MQDLSIANWYLLVLLLPLVLSLVSLQMFKKRGVWHDMRTNLWPRAFSKAKWSVWDKNINEAHGFVVACLFLIFGVLRWLTPTFLLVRPLPKHFGWWPFRREIWNEQINKSYPWWHDVAYALPLAVLGLGCWVSYKTADQLSLKVMGIWLLTDILVYHVNMFWLDDLRPKQRVTANVSSFRRSFFQSFVSYIFSIGVFACLYKPCSDLRKGLRTSLELATLNIPNDTSALSWLSLCQLLLSVLMLTIIISATANQAFRRGQIADARPGS